MEGMRNAAKTNSWETGSFYPLSDIKILKTGPNSKRLQRTIVIWLK